MTSKTKTWSRVFITLFIMSAGLPYVMMLLGLVLMPFDLSHHLFVPLLLIHNLYFSLPAFLFGDTLYPSESFGYLPGVVGYAIATVMYGLIAFALSFPVTAGIRKLKQRKTEANNELNAIENGAPFSTH